MAKLSTTLRVAAVLTLSSAYAQDPANPATPAPIPAPIAPPSAPVVTPAPIEPPIQPGQPGLPGGPAPQVLPPEGGLPGQPGVPSTANALPATAARLNDFQGDPIDLVLRTLARQAKMNIVVSDKVAQSGGTVNMRIEDKTPKEAIEIIVESKGLVMDQGKGGVYYIKTSEEKSKEPTESGNYTFSYAQAEKAVPLLQTQLQSGVAPQFDQRTNTIFFRENRSNMDKIKLFLQTIDTPTQQVMIEARLVEVNANPKQSYGINWAGVFGSSSTPQTITFAGSNNSTSTFNNAQVNTIGTTGGTTLNTTGTGTVAGGSGIPTVTTTGGTAATTGTSTVATTGNGTIGSNLTNTLVQGTNLFGNVGGFLRDANRFSSLGSAVAGQFAILNIPEMSATLRLLNEDSDAEFLAHPRVVTANNLKATIKITRNQPVPQLNFNEQTAQAVFSGFQDKEFGNTLIVTPSINKDDFITMAVQPEISNKVADATFTFSGATVTSPVIDKRTLDSNVVIKSGDTLAIGGLLQDEVTKGRTKVPVLGDIPILGYAFQERLNVRTKRNLLIFVTPTIIKQGYGTGLEDQVTGLHHSGEEYADPNGWRNNARGAHRLVPTSERQLAADYAKPGVPPAPKKTGWSPFHSKPKATPAAETEQ
jgi:type II secretory pathway component GspD/PulD (secretin)